MNQEPRTVMITGANSGIGKAATERFAVEGYQVVMACRSTERGAPVREEILHRTGAETIDLMELDTSSRESIDVFVRKFTTTYPRLDILIHNAAYFNHGEPYRVNPDGTEIAFATNVVGPYLLTSLLREHLSRSEDPRVLNVGSNIIKHFFSPRLTMDLSDMDETAAEPDGAADSTGPVSTSVYKRYCRSKMALLMLTRALSEELEPDGIAVNCLQVNGAKLSRETVRKFSRTYRILGRVQSVFLKSPEFMADRYFRIATSPEFRDVTGQNINHKLKIMQPAPTATPDGRPLRFMDEMRITTGADYYPAIAEDRELQAAVMQVCRNAHEVYSPRLTQRGADTRPGTPVVRSPKEGSSG
jgi:NAD(P)-dependent dehydrogenase (short-subunit alcohol dehydrogenase family)